MKLLQVLLYALSWAALSLSLNLDDVFTIKTAADPTRPGPGQYGGICSAEQTAKLRDWWDDSRALTMNVLEGLGNAGHSEAMRNNLLAYFDIHFHNIHSSNPYLDQTDGSPQRFQSLLSQSIPCLKPSPIIRRNRLGCCFKYGQCPPGPDLECSIFVYCIGGHRLNDAGQLLSKDWPLSSAKKRTFSPKTPRHSAAMNGFRRLNICVLSLTGRLCDTLTTRVRYMTLTCGPPESPIHPHSSKARLTG